MEEHKHTIAEVYRLPEVLESKAPKNHTHPEYATADHKHSGYAAKVHTHKDYAKSDHTHPELEAAIAALTVKGCKVYSTDELKAGMHQVVLTNVGNAVHIHDFITGNSVAFNCANIVIAPGKRLAARICKTETEAIVLLDGIINE